MRLIGHLPSETGAAIFSDYLLTQGISSAVEGEKEGWAIWIHSEDEFTRAKEMLDGFQSRPEDPRYREAAVRARALRKQAVVAEAAEPDRVMDREQVFRTGMAYRVGALTLVLIGLAVVVRLLEWAGYGDRILRELYLTALTVHGDRVSFAQGLPEISRGEFWRLFTPVLVHGGELHLLLNLMWLLDLGSMIEGRQGTGRLGLLVLVTAVLSNLGQYYLTGSPWFCGLSGVVYGLLGYIWMRGKFDPASGLFLHPHTVAMMLIWFALCFTGLLGPIANGSHAVGLILGVTWGFASAWFATRRG